MKFNYMHEVIKFWGTVFSQPPHIILINCPIGGAVVGQNNTLIGAYFRGQVTNLICDSETTTFVSSEKQIQQLTNSSSGESFFLGGVLST